MMDTSTVYEILARVFLILGVLMSIMTISMCIKYRIVQVVKGILFAGKNTTYRTVQPVNVSARTMQIQTREMSVEEVTQPLVRETQVLGCDNNFQSLFDLVEVHTEEKI